MWKEVVVVHFKLQFQYYPGGCEGQNNRF